MEHMPGMPPAIPSSKTSARAAPAQGTAWWHPAEELGSLWQEEGGFLMEDEGENRLELEAKQKLLLEQEICDTLR